MPPKSPVYTSQQKVPLHFYYETSGLNTHLSRPELLEDNRLRSKLLLWRLKKLSSERLGSEELYFFAHSKPASRENLQTMDLDLISVSSLRFLSIVASKKAIELIEDTLGERVVIIEHHSEPRPIKFPDARPNN